MLLNLFNDGFDLSPIILWLSLGKLALMEIDSQICMAPTSALKVTF